MKSRIRKEGRGKKKDEASGAYHGEMADEGRVLEVGEVGVHLDTPCGSRGKV